MFMLFVNLICRVFPLFKRNYPNSIWKEDLENW